LTTASWNTFEMFYVTELILYSLIFLFIFS